MSNRGHRAPRDLFKRRRRFSADERRPRPRPPLPLPSQAITEARRTLIPVLASAFRIASARRAPYRASARAHAHTLPCASSARRVTFGGCDASRSRRAAPPPRPSPSCTRDNEHAPRAHERECRITGTKRVRVWARGATIESMFESVRVRCRARRGRRTTRTSQRAGVRRRGTRACARACVSA